MKVEAKTIEEFFAAAGEREPIMRELDKIITKYAPSFERKLYSGMSMTGLGYGFFPYKTKSGIEGVWPIIGIAPQKNYVSLYVCATNNGKYIAEEFADKLGKVSVGKSCIRFKKFEDINLETLKDILRSLETRKKSGEILYGF